MYFFKNGVCIGICFLPDFDKWGLFIGENNQIRHVADFKSKEEAYEFYNLLHIFSGCDSIAKDIFEKECLDKSWYEDISEELNKAESLREKAEDLLEKWKENNEKMH